MAVLNYIEKYGVTDFAVQALGAAEKTDYVKIEVVYPSSDKVYTYVRKVYAPGYCFVTEFSKVIIDGVVIEFNNDYEIKNAWRKFYPQTKRRRSGSANNNGNGEGAKQQETKKTRRRRVFKEVPEEEVKQPKQEAPKQQEAQKNEGGHALEPVIKSLINSNIPVYLYGPAGSGKNFTLEKVAADLGLDFYFLNSVQSEFKITGFVDAGGKYHETEFYKAFKFGGVFFLDELDGSIPEVLILLNAAIANRYFDFNNGEGRIVAHPDFRIVAAGNTAGSGATEEYNGRMVLDAATLDRFAMLEFTYDPDVELHMCKNDRELCDFVRDCRKVAADLGIRGVFSYRCMSYAAKMNGMMTEADIIKYIILKGFDNDTISLFANNVTEGGRFDQALKTLTK